ncbi:unnamed protein product [Camellia sinensis]
MSDYKLAPMGNIDMEILNNLGLPNCCAFKMVLKESKEASSTGMSRRTYILCLSSGKQDSNLV